MKNIYESIFGSKSDIAKDAAAPIIQDSFRNVYGERVKYEDGFWVVAGALVLDGLSEYRRNETDNNKMPTPPLKCNGLFFGNFNIDGNKQPELSHIITPDIFMDCDKSFNLSYKNTYIEINNIDHDIIQFDGNKRAHYTFENVTIESTVKHDMMKFQGGSFDINNVTFKGIDTIVFNDFVSKRKMKGLYNAEVRSKMNNIFIEPGTRKKITGVSILKKLEASHNEFYNPDIFLNDAEYYNINPSARLENIFPWIKNSPDVNLIALNVMCSVNYILGDDVYIYLIRDNENLPLPRDMHKKYPDPKYKVKDIKQYEKLKTSDGWYVIFYGK